MIYVKDKGRLCNNILQFGHAYAWARENGLKAVSMRFSYKYKGFRICHTRGHNIWTYLWAKYASALKIIPTVDYASPLLSPGAIASHENKLLHHARTGVVLSGWWVRHYDLFLKYRDEIAELFSFDENADDVPDLPSAAENSVWLGVHVRRGDYAKWNGGRYFYTDRQYLEIINRFVELMAQRDVQVNVAVFTNDPELDPEYFSSEIDMRAGELLFPCGSSVSDLRAMSQCDYIIGPPSTYSLVASMYRDRPIYFITEPEKQFTLSDFSDFEHLFRYNY